MFAKRLHVILAAVALVLCSVNICYAESNVAPFQAYAWEQSIDVYIVGDMNPDSLNCKVPSQVVETAGSGLLADGDITGPTTILPTPLPTSSEASVTVAPMVLVQSVVPVKATAYGLSSDIFGGYTLVTLIGAGTGLIVTIAVIVTVIAIRRKKKRKNGRSSSLGENSSLSKKTEIVGISSSGSASGSLCIRLRNISNPDQIWDLSLSATIIIGRDTNSQVCIDESSVSRQQCRIYLLNNAPMAENMSNSNITQHNGEKLLNPRPIKEGDKLKCGRVTLTVDSLYGSDSSNVGNLNKMTEFVNV